MSRTKWNLIGLSVVSAILIAGFLFVKWNFQKKNSSASALEVLQDLKQQFKLLADINQSKIYLFDERGRIVPLKGYSIDLTSKDGYLSNEGLNNWENATRKFFETKDFIKDNRNTKRENSFWASGTLQSRLIFKRDSIICRTQLDTGSSLYLTFFCGSIDLATLSWNTELANIIPIQQGWKDIDVQKYSSDFASGAFFVYDNPTSVKWIAVKQYGKWRSIFEGQGLPLCKTMTSFNVPKGIYGECSETE